MNQIIEFYSHQFQGIAGRSNVEGWNRFALTYTNVNQNFIFYRKYAHFSSKKNPSRLGSEAGWKR